MIEMQEFFCELNSWASAIILTGPKSSRGEFEVSIENNQIIAIRKWIVSIFQSSVSVAVCVYVCASASAIYLDNINKSINKNARLAILLFLRRDLTLQVWHFAHFSRTKWRRENNHHRGNNNNPQRYTM